MQTLSHDEIEVGLVVYYVDRRLNTPGSHVWAPSDTDDLSGQEAIVVAVQDVIGKHIGLCMKKRWTQIPGHTLDGLVPEGYGRWALPEQLYTEEDLQRHKKAAGDHGERVMAIAKLLEGYLEP